MSCCPEGCYAHTVVAAHEGNLAFVAIAGNESAGGRIFNAIESYANEHPVVYHTVLRSISGNKA